MILKNVMNDLYARDTSSKIRAVKQSLFRVGKYVAAFAPYGYRKSADDKHILVIDPATAPTVRRIYDLRCQGYSYRKIAAILNGDAIPCPRDAYYTQKGGANPRNDKPFWSDVAVRMILTNEAYIGNTVQSKVTKVSYKVHKQVSRPKEEWVRVENTHEPLVTREVWELVRTMDEKPARNRTSKDGTVHLFTGVARCMDCGTTLRYHSNGYKRKNGTTVKSGSGSYVCGRYASCGKGACTTHTISQAALEQVVLADIRTKAALAQNDPSGLVRQIQTQRRAATTEQIKQTRALLTAVEKRLAELSKLIQAIYEDKVMGRVPEAICIQLMNQYEDERTEKLEQRARLSAELEMYQQETDDVQQWIKLIQDFSKLESLDRPTLLRLIKKIEVGEKKIEDGCAVRDIKIHYNFVGYIEA